MTAGTRRPSGDGKGWCETVAFTAVEEPSIEDRVAALEQAAAPVRAGLSAAAAPRRTVALAATAGAGAAQGLEALIGVLPL